MVHVKTMEDAKIMEDVDTTATNPVTVVKEDAVHRTTGIGVEDVGVNPTVILHTTVGHTECVPIGVKTAGLKQVATKRTRYGVPRCQAVKVTATDRSGQYLLVKLT